MYFSAFNTLMRGKPNPVCLLRNPRGKGVGIKDGASWNLVALQEKTHQKRKPQRALEKGVAGPRPLLTS